MAVVEDGQRAARVAALRQALRLDGVQPGVHLGGRAPAASVCAGTAHPIGHLLAAAGPSGDKCRVAEDRGTEERIIGGSGGMQRADEGAVGGVGLPQVEKLDPAQQQGRLREGPSEHAPGHASGLPKQGLAEGRVLGHSPMKGCGGDRPVHLPVRGSDGGVGGTDGVGLDAVGLSRTRDRWAGGGRDDWATAVSGGVGLRLSEPELRDGESQAVRQHRLMVVLRPRRIRAEPAADLADADAVLRSPQAAGAPLEGLLQRLVTADAGGQHGRSKRGVAVGGACHRALQVNCLRGSKTTLRRSFERPSLVRVA